MYRPHNNPTTLSAQGHAVNRDSMRRHRAIWCWSSETEHQIVTFVSIVQFRPVFISIFWNTIRYDTIEEINVDSKAEYTAQSSTRSQKYSRLLQQGSYRLVRYYSRFRHVTDKFATNWRLNRCNGNTSWASWVACLSNACPRDPISSVDISLAAANASLHGDRHKDASSAFTTPCFYTVARPPLSVCVVVWFHHADVVVERPDLNSVTARRESKVCIESVWR